MRCTLIWSVKLAINICSTGHTRVTLIWLCRGGVSYRLAFIGPKRKEIDVDGLGRNKYARFVAELISKRIEIYVIRAYSRIF